MTELSLVIDKSNEHIFGTLPLKGRYKIDNRRVIIHGKEYKAWGKNWFERDGNMQDLIKLKRIHNDR